MESIKGTIIKTVLLVVLALVLVFAAYVFYTWPIYPVFRKQVSSIGEIQNALKDKQEIVIPDALPEIDFDGNNTKYEIKFDGRNRYSKPIGYCLGDFRFADETMGYTCECVFACDPEADGRKTERIDVNEEKNIKDKGGRIAYSVYHAGYSYYLAGMYSITRDMSDEDFEMVHQTIKDKLSKAADMIAKMGNN